MAEIEGWVNWNPVPKVHAYGATTSRFVVGLCRTTVRKRRGTFDPNAPDSCPECAQYVRAGLTFEEAQQRVNERVVAVMESPTTIVCRRGVGGLR